MITDTQRRMLEQTGMLDKMYAQTITSYIRLRYSVDDELAIQRQREEKPEDFETYYAFVEDCKVRARKEIYGEDIEPLELSATTKEYLEQLERLGL